MATKFKKEDALTRFHGVIQPRLSDWSPLNEFHPDCDRGLAPECMVMLLCRQCLKFELDQFHDFLGQVETPFGNGEKEKSFLPRQIGILAVPLSISVDESQLLVDEPGTDGMECVVNLSWLLFPSLAPQMASDFKTRSIAKEPFNVPDFVF
jgi:hypothetical protein